MPSLLSVNVGMPHSVAWQGKTVYTSVWKHPVRGPGWCDGSTLTGMGRATWAGGLVQTSIQVGGGVLLAAVTAVIGTPHSSAAVLAQYHKGTWVIAASCLAALVPV